MGPVRMLVAAGMPMLAMVLAAALAVGSPVGVHASESFGEVDLGVPLQSVI